MMQTRTIEVTESTAAFLDARFGFPMDAPAEVLERDLTRYEAIIDTELDELALTEAEAALIVDVRHNAYFERPGDAYLLAAVVEDAIQHDHVAKKWDVDGSALIDRLRTLSLAGAIAVDDAIWRFWKSEDDLTVAERLRRVGLVRPEGGARLRAPIHVLI